MGAERVSIEVTGIVCSEKNLALSAVRARGALPRGLARSGSSEPRPAHIGAMGESESALLGAMCGSQ